MLSYFDRASCTKILSQDGYGFGDHPMLDPIPCDPMLQHPFVVGLLFFESEIEFHRRAASDRTESDRASDCHRTRSHLGSNFWCKKHDRSSLAQHFRQIPTMDEEVGGSPGSSVSLGSNCRSIFPTGGLRKLFEVKV